MSNCCKPNCKYEVNVTLKDIKLFEEEKALLKEFEELENIKSSKELDYKQQVRFDKLEKIKQIIKDEDENQKAVIKAEIKIKHHKFYDIINDFKDLKGLSNLPSVYCFYAEKDSSGEKKCVYVGKAKNVWSRVRSHVKGVKSTYELSKMLRYVEIFQLETNDEAHLELLEQMIFFEKKPFHNRKTIGAINDADYQFFLNSTIKRKKWKKEDRKEIERLYKPSKWAKEYEEKMKSSKVQKNSNKMIIK